MTIFEEMPGLLQRFRDGAKDAYEAVYRRYFSDVYRLFCRGFVTGTPPCSVPALTEEQALEHLQEVFLRAFEQRARTGYDGLRPYRPYLLRIAKNYRIDVFRRERHVESERGPNDESGRVDLDRMMDLSSPIAPLDIEGSHHHQSQLEQTQIFLSGLSEDERRFVTLRFVQEQPQAVVAANLGVTRRKVRTLEAQIQRQLQQHLAQQGLY